MNQSQYSSIDFSVIQFIGYYPNDKIQLEKERIYKKESLHLAQSLQNSLEKMIDAGDIGSDTIDTISHSILLFKNKDKHLFAYNPEKRCAHISGVPFVRDMLQRISYGYFCITMEERRSK